MATVNTVKMQIQFRRDTHANWELYKDKVTPAAGEPCFDIDEGTLKIGNGKDTYANLKVIGGSDTVSVSADGSSIVLENSVFKLAGFDTAEVGAQPRKNADGFIEWVIPAVDEGMDGLLVEVDALRTDVDALKEKMDGTGEGSVDAKIVAKINEFATKVNDNTVVDSYKELIDYVAEHGGEAATMAANITNLKELVGNKSVETQINDAIADLSVSGEENVIEVINLGGTALEVVNESVNIPVGAGLKASDEVEIAEDGTLSVGTISFSKITTDDSSTVILDGGSAG